ncbi:hypothetical protein [uncultured Ruminococcus sp.]|uniref:hypothetical protein n=1 Tax=uncultured Ruminococcus sp. TaxID=165186 RepID=UPI0025F1F597|nr:hypothetical protein [uncultured Ruminococcus sp.]
MVATTPEDIQISLGKIYSNNTKTTASASEEYTLGDGTGWLKLDGTMAEAPRGVTVSGTTYTADAHDELDWSNIADISAYYEFGKLIPASSHNGVNVFFTPDAAGSGRTLNAQAKFYQAVAGLTPNLWKSAANTFASDGTGASAQATAHIYGDDKTNATTHTWGVYDEDDNADGYKKSTEWNVTNDDGYYIDIPVWLRTSSTETTKLYVTGYVTSQGTSNADEDTDDLYKAVRVAILTDAGAVDQGCLALNDGLDKYIDPVTGQATHANKFPTTAGGVGILDSLNYNNRHDDVTTGIFGVSDTTNAANGNFTDVGHTALVVNDGGTGKEVATLAVGNGAEYGPATKLIIRVWLEGEDENCWNENAGQNWNIALKFSKTPLAAGS